MCRLNLSQFLFFCRNVTAMLLSINLAENKLMKDKTKYFIACSIISLIVAAVEATLGAGFRHAMVAGVIAGVAVGVGKEYGDSRTPGKKWDWGDLGADVAGSFFGSAVGTLVCIL